MLIPTAEYIETSAESRIAAFTDLNLLSNACCSVDHGCEPLSVSFLSDEPLDIVTVVFYYFFIGNGGWTDAWCIRGVVNFETCRQEHDGTTVSVRRNHQLVKECGIVNLGTGLSQQDQIYTINCGAIGEEIYLENKKNWFILFFRSGSLHSQFP